VNRVEPSAAPTAALSVRLRSVHDVFRPERIVSFTRAVKGSVLVRGDRGLIRRAADSLPVGFQVVIDTLDTNS
jgi:hypothetical protein